MNFKRILIIITVLIFFSTCIYAEDSSLSFTSSTNLTSDLSGIIKDKNLTTDEILYAKDIKLLGVDTIPELLRYISGVNVYKVNNSTVNFSMRGIPAFYRIHPLILVDGMEYSETLYDKVFFYNFPVSIDDIDRIEVIKDPTKFVNGLDSPGGIINIVTKKPEMLSSNYVNTFIGSNNLMDTNFAINKYYKSVYYKATGEFRKIDKYHSGKRALTNKFVNIAGTKFFENSKLFTKFSFLNNEFNFDDFYRTKINGAMIGSKVNISTKNQKLIDFIADYTFDNTNLSFYVQRNTGDINLVSTKFNPFHYEYYKLNFKKFLKFNSFGFTSGLIASYFNSKVNSVGSGKKESLILYLNSEYSLTHQIKISWFMKNKKARNLGDMFSFKANLSYLNKKNNLFLELGYSKSYRDPSLVSQYYFISRKFNFMNMPVTVNYFPDKELKSEKIYSTFFNMSKKINNLTLKTELFYNRMANLFGALGKFYLFQQKIDMGNKNVSVFTIHGIDTSLEYKFGKKLRWKTSYYAQHFNNKTDKIQGNWLMPQYKFMSILFFDYPVLSGNFKYTYMPRIHTKCSGRSDYISTFDLTLIKYFFKRKLEASLNCQNLFNEIGKESPYGNKLERSFIVKIQYNF